MAHFIVTFRIKSDSGYQSRYNSFVERVRKVSGLGSWDETSSFYAFEASGTASTICSDLYFNSEFNGDTDTLVVIDLDNRAKATRGVLNYPALLAAGLGF